ncbi:hypothetical protein [Rariglobus hedericola]|uniref:Metal-dependent phosphohydrolase n=1 Tax=Rariglobus hedericola TaxID=2597822 RepID=A0A556QMV0_9BACT|nr:hypothetical protein [Rariglobus hedericola]TSJ77968.1 hypothetical protein FPL22_01260 [Rariglobus hedericola]
MPLTTDTTRAESVTEAILDATRTLFPGASETFTCELLAGVQKLFTGGYLDYQANDLSYHDFRHTLQVTVAYVDLFAARQTSGETPFTHRQFELGLATALLHDSGYLKLRSDRLGTGAKYTFCHVLRSCALSASYLPTLGLKIDEIDTVLGAIRCTGPSTTGMKLRFNRRDDHVLASMVATADYLGQMAADDYPDELELLFNEFAESDAFLGLPSSQRVFKSPAQLIAGTSLFWEKVVRPKLENDFLGVYRFLTQADGTHPYIDAVERNLGEIARRHSVAAI